MAWYVNRSGQQDGPYEEAQILQMIQSGQLTSGHVAQAGSGQWTPIEQVPQFAQALGAVRHSGYPAAPQGSPAAPQGYPAPPQGSPAAPQGYPAAPQGYAAAPGAQQGAVQAGYPPAPGAPPAGAPAAPPKKKKGAPIGLILAVVGVVVLGGAATGLYFMFRGVSSVLSASVPPETQVFVEMPSVPAALRSFVSMGVIDAEKIDGEKLSEDLTEGMAEAFDVEDEQARAVLESVESVAFAMRSVDDDPEGAVLVSFSDADGVTALLESDRFEEEGDVGGGTRYALERLDFEWEDAKDWTEARKAFSTMNFDEDDDDEAFVWFPDEKLLAVGHEDFIEDVGAVVIDGEAALSDEDKWSRVSYPDDASAIVFVDSALLDEIDDDDAEKFLDDYMSDVAPFTASVRFTEAGIVYNISGELRGEKVNPDDQYPLEARSLKLYEKLPTETVAYYAISTQTGMSGEDMKEWMLDVAEDTDEDAAEELEDGFDDMEDELDFSMEDLLDAIGDEMAVAVAFEPDVEIELDKEPKEWMDEGGFALLFHLRDREKASEILDEIKGKTLEDGPGEQLYDVDDENDGFDASPESEAEDKVPEVKVRLTDEYLLVAAGGLSERFVEALDGTDTLADDAAHDTALGVFEGAHHFVIWADTGRIGKALLDYVEDEEDIEEEIEELEEELGLELEAIRLEGDERITSALVAGVEYESDHWTYRIETLNVSAFAAGFGMYETMKPRGSTADFGGPSSGGVYLPDTGVPACDVLVMSKHSCGKRTNDAALKAEARADEKHYKTKIGGNPSKKESIKKECRDKHMKFIRSNEKCTKRP